MAIGLLNCPNHNVWHVAERLSCGMLEEVDELARLTQIVNALGPSIVRVTHSMPDLDPEIAGLVIHDELRELRPTSAGLLLAVGVCPAGEPWLRLLERAEAGGFGCVAVKTYGIGERQIAEAAGSGSIPVLLLADEVSWEQLIALLSSAISYSRPAGQGDGGNSLGDLFTLANAVASAIGGATAIADPARRMLAYSTVDGQLIDDTRRQSILDLQVPTDPQIVAEYQAVHSAPGVIEVAGRGTDLPRLATSIRAGGELLGSMWVIDPGEQERELACRRLVEASNIAALHLLRVRTEREGLHRRRSDLLTALLAQADVPHDVMKRLALPATTNARIAALALAEIPPETEPTAAVHQVLDLVTLHCQGELGFSAATAIDDVVYVLLPAPPGRARSLQQRLLAGVAAHVRRSYGYRLRIGAGGEVADLKDAARSREQADRVIQLMGLPSRQSTRTTTTDADIVFAEDVRPQIALLHLAERCPVADPAMDETINTMAEYDRSNNSQYLPTLSSYLQAHGDIAGMARALHVHANTCRYRLSRMKELFDVDLTDADARLVMALQLRLRDLVA
ncbi:PucR family transcriptional regulator [Kitasatospora sp. NPDC087315]|uniref:PucR family transcriptional regulator n=1 Tax=Kitasatospora sp. NPDC087315 TaxID=3364069 RepID=UPI003802A8BF